MYQWVFEMVSHRKLPNILDSEVVTEPLLKLVGAFLANLMCQVHIRSCKTAESLRIRVQWAVDSSQKSSWSPFFLTHRNNTFDYISHVCRLFVGAFSYETLWVISTSCRITSLFSSRSTTKQLELFPHKCHSLHDICIMNVA